MRDFLIIMTFVRLIAYIVVIALNILEWFLRGFAKFLYHFTIISYQLIVAIGYLIGCWSIYAWKYFAGTLPERAVKSPPARQVPVSKAPVLEQADSQIIVPIYDPKTGKRDINAEWKARFGCNIKDTVYPIK